MPHWSSSDYHVWVDEIECMENYKLLYKEKNLTLYVKQVEGIEGNGGSRYKWSGIIPFSTDVVWMTAADYTLEERKLWDKQIIDWQILDYSKETDLETKKCDHEKDPKNPDNVRVDTHVWAMWLKPKKVDGKDYTEYHVISQFSPNGWVPEYIISWGISSLPKTIESELIEGCHATIKKGVKLEDFRPRGFNDLLECPKKSI